MDDAESFARNDRLKAMATRIMEHQPALYGQMLDAFGGWLEDVPTDAAPGVDQVAFGLSKFTIAQRNRAKAIRQADWEADHGHHLREAVEALDDTEAADIATKGKGKGRAAGPTQDSRRAATSSVVIPRPAAPRPKHNRELSSA